MFMNFVAFNNFLRIKSRLHADFLFSQAVSFLNYPIQEKKLKCKGEQINLKT
jgi:hypothetical protein